MVKRGIVACKGIKTSAFSFGGVEKGMELTAKSLGVGRWQKDIALPGLLLTHKGSCSEWATCLGVT